MFNVINRRVFWVPQILTWIDIGISIGGFIAVSKKDRDQLLPTPYSRAGIAILALIYFFTAGVFVYFWLRRRQYSQEEYWLAMCVGVCNPFLFIRLLYSLIFVITADMTWNAVKGSPTAYLLMTFLPEVAIVAICTFTVENTSPKDELADRKDQWAGNPEERQGFQGLDSMEFGHNPSWTFHGVALRRF